MAPFLVMALNQPGMASNTIVAPGKRSEHRTISWWASAGSRYMRSPWAVIITPSPVSTPSIHFSSTADTARTS